jgi:Ethanolamine utilization protein EutJ (predicted chaperonin)
MMCGNQNFVFWSLGLHGYTAAQWTETLVDVGAGTTGIAMGADGLVFTNAANEDDGAQTQYLRTFTPAANKYAFMYFRVKSSEATQFDWWNGFAGVDTSVVAGIPTHVAGIEKADAAAVVKGQTKDGTTASYGSSNLVAVYAADTEYDFGVSIHGTTAVIFHYKLATASSWSQLRKTTNLPTTAMRPTFAELNGEATADTMTITRACFGWTL